VIKNLRTTENDQLRISLIPYNDWVKRCTQLWNTEHQAGKNNREQENDIISTSGNTEGTRLGVPE
jgi:hypothetical protein